MSLHCSIMKKDEIDYTLLTALDLVRVKSEEKAKPGEEVESKVDSVGQIIRELSSIAVDESRVAKKRKPQRQDENETVESVKKPKMEKIKVKLKSKKNSAARATKFYRCPDCTYVSERLGNFNRHFKSMHLNTINNVCCGISFTNKADRSLHRHQFHKHGYKCDMCTKIFDRRALLVRHASVHTGIKPFKCEDCTYSTSHKSNLIRHLKSCAIQQNQLVEKKPKLDSVSTNDDSTASSSILDVNSTPSPNLSTLPQISTPASTSSQTTPSTPRSLILDETLRTKGPLKYFHARAVMENDQPVDLSLRGLRVPENPQHKIFQPFPQQLELIPTLPFTYFPHPNNAHHYPARFYPGFYNYPINSALDQRSFNGIFNAMF